MEKHFKNKLKTHKVDWDKEALFDRFEDELPKREPTFNWKLLLLLPLLFIATCYGVSKSDLQVNNVGQPTIYTETVREIDSKIPSGSHLNALKTNTQDSSNVTSKFDNIIAANPQLNNTTTNQQLKSTTFTSATQAIQKEEHNNNNNSTGNRPATFTYNFSTKLNKRPNSNPTYFSRNNEEQNLAPEKLSRPSNSTNKPTNKQTGLLTLLPSLALTAIPNNNQFPLSFKTRNYMGLPDSLKHEKLGIKNSFYYSVFAEAGIPYRVSNYLTFNIDLINRLARNESSVDARFSFGTGFGVGYQYKSGLSLQTGFQYQEILEKLNYSSTKIRKEIELVDNAFFIVTQNADTLFYQDSVRVLTVETRTIKNWNRLAYFTIPVTIGYHKSLGRMNMFGTMGVNYSFSNNFNGVVNQVNTDLTTEIIEDPTFNFKNRFGFQVGWGLEYPLLRQTKIFAQLKYTKSPKMAAIVREQKYHSFSFGIGVKYFVE